MQEDTPSLAEKIQEMEKDIHSIQDGLGNLWPVIRQIQASAFVAAVGSIAYLGTLWGWW
ncbi:hypothetical protein IV417_16115 [Alphaproteobacteria bacterium KMM 3653]|uniref:Uncharacterized protein n=1 Tax=Harenicola maris TaxID=2841044 RepID=A0AAP2CRD4_9RHOB|nr:hypothetical protein [Harenicola maris]